MTSTRLKKLVKDLAENYRRDSLTSIAKRNKVKMKFVASGITRYVYLLVGTNIVLKIGQGGYQSESELENIAKFKKNRKLRKYLPKVYKHGCHISHTGKSIIAMRYYPKKASDNDCTKMDSLFGDYLGDVHNNNVRKSTTGKLKLIDLGI